MWAIPLPYRDFRVLCAVRSLEADLTVTTALGRHRAQLAHSSVRSEGLLPQSRRAKIKTLARSQAVDSRGGSNDRTTVSAVAGSHVQCRTDMDARPDVDAAKKRTLSRGTRHGPRA